MADQDMQKDMQIKDEDKKEFHEKAGDKQGGQMKDPGTMEERGEKGTHPSKRKDAEGDEN